MNDRIIRKEDLQAFLKALQKTHEVLVPVKEKGFHGFKPMTGDEQGELQFQNTRLSPKGFVLPESERMFQYTVGGKATHAQGVEELPEDTPARAVVGIRPCDAKAYVLVNKNFDNPAYQDPWWAKRLASLTLVGLGCNEPCSTCFCTSVGCGPFHEEGLDVLLFDLGESFLARAVTAKGEQLLREAGVNREADGDSRKKAAQLKEKAEKKIPSQVPTDRLKEKKLNELFEAPFWEDVAFACINCGTCTFLCPTCWCFDIQDEVTRTQGDRIRNWDSCMFPLFTLHASGHNPRTKKAQRVRQRFMHKLKYYVDKYGDGVACVGCGRCVIHCPVNIDIREVAKRMNEF